MGLKVGLQAHQKRYLLPGRIGEDFGFEVSVVVLETSGLGVENKHIRVMKTLYLLRLDVYKLQ